MVNVGLGLQGFKDNKEINLDSKDQSKTNHTVLKKKNVFEEGTGK